MDYPIPFAGQLSAHLRALRKMRGLSQAQLGALLGVGQTRITRIERDPASVSVEQFLAVLAALGAQMVLRAKPTAATGESSSASDKKGTPGRAAAARRHPPTGAW